jgi:hypothetical protein
MADPLDVTGQENVIPDAGGNAPSAPTTPSPGLNESIEKAFDASPAAKTLEEPEKPATGPLDRPRDPFGRFAPKEGGTPGQAAPGAPTTPGAIAPGPGAAAPPTFAEPPASWRPEMRPLYDKVPAEVRPYLHQREQELQYGFDAVARRGNVAEAVLNEFVPYADQLQAEGATPVTAMRTLLQTAHQLRTGGPEFRKAIILNLAQQYSVDLSQPVNVEIARAEAQAAQLLTERMYGSAANQQQVQQQSQQEFMAFANDPQNEFFPKVRHIMAALIENNVAPNLRVAYDMAIGMDGDIRTTLIDREYQKRTQALKQNAAANVSLRGAPNGTGMAPAGAAIGESVRASLERVIGGG